VRTRVVNVIHDSCKAGVEPIEFRLLGPLEVLCDGIPRPLSGQRQRVLLAMLLLRAGKVVSVDQLIDKLWNGSPPRTAVASVHNGIVQLRRLVGADTLRTRSPGYFLQVAPEQIDAMCFERLLESSRGYGVERRRLLLGNALALWRGPVLAELQFETFVQPEVQRLEELHIQALEERIETDLELGRHQFLVPELQQLVAVEPLRERFRVQLMLALYRCGRQVEALDVYRRTRMTLAEQLGIDPCLELKSLERAVLRQDPLLDLSGAGTRGIAPNPLDSSSVPARVDALGLLDRTRERLARWLAPELANG